MGEQVANAENVVGRGLLMVLRLIGRKRALLRMAENFRTADSVSHVSTVEKAPTCIQLRFGATDGLGPHMLGLMREGLVMLNTKEDPCTVEGADDGAGGFTIDVKW